MCVCPSVSVCVCYACLVRSAFALLLPLMPVIAVVRCRVAVVVVVVQPKATTEHAKPCVADFSIKCLREFTFCTAAGQFVSNFHVCITIIRDGNSLCGFRMSGEEAE